VASAVAAPGGRLGKGLQTLVFGVHQTGCEIADPGAAERNVDGCGLNRDVGTGPFAQRETISQRGRGLFGTDLLDEADQYALDVLNHGVLPGLPTSPNVGDSAVVRRSSR
jgi:hypothetical protein